MFGDTVPSELPDKWAISIREPIGVAGLITPWNFPMAIPMLEDDARAHQGNTLVIKPASDTPGCVAAAGRSCCTRRASRRASSTWSPVPARRWARPSWTARTCRSSASRATATRAEAIAQAAGARLKRLSLELGGKNAIVVLDDADIDLAVEGILWSAFGTTGQRCTACSRVVVQERGR